MWFYVVAKLINVFYFCKSVFDLLFLCAINLLIFVRYKFTHLLKNNPQNYCGCYFLFINLQSFKK